MYVNHTSPSRSIGNSNQKRFRLCKVLNKSTKEERVKKSFKKTTNQTNIQSHDPIGKIGKNR